MEINSFLSSETTKEIVAKILCDARTNSDKIVGNLALASTILKQLKILDARQKGKNYFAFPVISCRFVKLGDEYLQDTTDSTHEGWYISSLEDGYLSSGFWVKEKLIPLLKPLSSVPSNPILNYQNDRDLYKCIGTNAVMVELDVVGVSNINRSLSEGFFYQESKDLHCCSIIKRIPLPV